MNLPLISETQKYRAETESEAYSFIEEQKNLSLKDNFELKKYTCERKEKKAKGEVIDEYYYVTLVKNYDI